MAPSLLAQLYALLHRGTPGDVAFYRRLCAGAPHVLELGAGYGRVAIALARAGSEVLALDLDEQMLALARAAAASEAAEVQARLDYVVADMTRFSLGRRFERVLIPYNGLCCLLEPTAVRSCLEHAREHLAPGGRLALDVYRADDLHHDAPDDQGEEDDDEPVVAIDHGDRIYRVYEESSWQRAPQRLDTCYRFVPADGGGILEQTLCQRYLLADELEELVSDAGLVVVERAGGFAGEPLDDQADELVLVAERKP